MTRFSRLRVFAVMAVVALVAAVPALASGTPSHGNKCGKGHAKHSKAVGKTCAKQKARSAAVIRQAKRENESPASVVAEDQAGTTDAADREDANDATENDQGDNASENDQGDDASENDQGDAAENDQADAPDTETDDTGGD